MVRAYPVHPLVCRRAYPGAAPRSLASPSKSSSFPAACLCGDFEQTECRGLPGAPAPPRAAPRGAACAGAVRPPRSHWLSGPGPLRAAPRHWPRLPPSARRPLAAAAAWRARAAPGGRPVRARITGGSGSIAAGCATPSTTTTRTGSCRSAAAGGRTTRPAAPGRGTAPPPRRKLCARVKELELWKNRNMLQCGSSGRAHQLTGTYLLTTTNQINRAVFGTFQINAYML